jgi:hypothetical protein
MARPSLLRIVPVALLVLVMAVPCALAEEPLSPTPRLDAVTDLLHRLWDGFVSLWMENGCGIDPHGGCVPDQPSEPAPDNGCGADPNGSCQSGG